MHKKIILTTILCLFINNSGLLNCIELQNCNITSTTKSIHMPVCWGILCSISSSIRDLSNFIMENCPISKPLKHNKTNPEKQKNTSSDYFIMASFKKVQEYKKQKTSNIFDANTMNTSKRLVLTNKIINQNLPPDIINFLCLFLLAYIVVLFRSNLPWSIISSIINKRKNPTFYEKLGFFFIGENNEIN